MPASSAIPTAVGTNGSVMITDAGMPRFSKKMASSTLLDEHDPQSPIPETTKSLSARSASSAVSSTSWLGERLRTIRVTVIP
jgi:hypothetical protein